MLQYVLFQETVFSVHPVYTFLRTFPYIIESPSMLQFVLVKEAVLSVHPVYTYSLC